MPLSCRAQAVVTAGEPTLVRGNVQRCDAVEFIKAMHLRDPRVAPHLQFSSKPQRAIEAIWAWGAPPSDDDTFFFDMLEVRTDGSAVLRKGWPVVPISAGWGALFVVVKPDRSWRFLGALWGPVDVNESSQYFLGATRPTIPVAEITAFTVVLMLLRQMQFQGSVAWGTDSLYALGIMTLGYGGATECNFVNGARKEARVAKASWNLKGFHTPSHIGFPPKECADVLALLGRLRVRLSQLVARSIESSVPPNLTCTAPVTFSLADALIWTEVERGEDPQQKRKVKKCNDEFCIMVCATANVLTLHPAEERLSATEPNLDSHRRFDFGFPILCIPNYRCWPSRDSLECCTSSGYRPVPYLCRSSTCKGPGRG